MNSRWFSALLVVLVIGGILLIVLEQAGWFDAARPRPRAFEEISKPTQTPKVAAPSLSKALGVSEEDLVEVGGIKRPKRDLAFKPPASQNNGEGNESEPDPFEKSLYRHPGSAPAVPADANPQVSALYASLDDPEGPLAARSALFAPEPFDLTAYQKDPAAWLDLIRPGRVFEPALPGEGVEPIKTRSSIFQHVLQGERVNLEVQVKPGMPVTFYTPQVGEFPNRLTTHSVAADEEGIARTVYFAGPGTLGIINIMSASPVHSGVLRYKVRVSLPE